MQGLLLKSNYKVGKEWPEIAWKLIIGLLPNQHQGSSGTHKPYWRKTIPEGWKKDVSPQDYWAQVSFYADLAVSMAGYDKSKLVELIGHFDNLPRPSFDKLIGVLSSDVISGLPEDKRLHLWDSLTKFTSNHRRFSEEKWALSDKLLTPIESIAEKLAPTNPLNLYRHLFSNHAFDLYDDNNNYEEQEKKLDDRRKKAVEEILQLGGLKSVINFSEAVETPNQVGHSLGSIGNAEIDNVLLPSYLSPENHNLANFISGYIWNRRYKNGFPWSDNLDKSAWSSKQIGQFLSYLPFTNETWDRATKWLGIEESEYWLINDANPYQTEGDLSFAIDKLIKYGRPRSAINCLFKMHHSKKPFNVSQNISQCICALLTALSSAEPSHSMEAYHIIRLIKFLQINTDVSPDDLFRVEWAYLPLLASHRGASPKLLENRLASDPNFFCKAIRLIFRSKKSEVSTKEPTNEKKELATNAWRLLHEWRRPPGLRENGSFNDAHFLNWLQRVKEICTESGHLEVALINVGEVLIHCPPDTNGLWINRIVADAINEKDAEHIRSGYSTGTYNSRGAHCVDPTGKPELELAEQYQKKAEEVEDAGYQRFAVTLRNLSESYAREAERIISEHKGETEDE